MKRAFFVVLAVAVIVVAAGVIILRSTSMTEVAITDGVHFRVVRISGGIDSVGAKRVIKALHAAEKAKMEGVVFQMVSPGGEVASSLDIAEAISHSPLKTYAWVKEGVGAAMFVVAAVDKVYFTPDGIVGGVSGVVASNTDAEDIVSRRLINLLSERLKSIATAKGHDAEIFAAMIDPNTRLVRGAKVWKEKKTIMSLTAREASTLGLSSGEYESLNDLLVRIQQEDTANRPPR